MFSAANLAIFTLLLQEKLSRRMEKVAKVKKGIKRLAPLIIFLILYLLVTLMRDMIMTYYMNIDKDNHKQNNCP
jgi:NhaP-type Na+/H+ and K+/H+ antiporter